MSQQHESTDREADAIKGGMGGKCCPTLERCVLLCTGTIMVAMLGSIPDATLGKLINKLKGNALTEGLWNLYLIRKNKDVQPGEEET